MNLNYYCHDIWFINQTYRRNFSTMRCLWNDLYPEIGALHKTEVTFWFC